ncbi:enoyl-CoA hydratase/isomerase family protein [Roseomonas xinghualingensis]|uniref:enoyl-CoA hydratase/isomerase family protein n=1 Tax=Roseomonas xinghualingensis TaxID=2986475 RepID=UPI0021F174B7|nr:enoyl-CoA hydratase/isomerase family protein [Roseomonas sp. SXEYE001]MCV4208291.1 enoyl-CoA hydratase/isomerase family protein [Roseomonas sp. SXEYE001]
MDEAEASVLARIEGRAGLILMNRPRALNALDQGMIDALTEAATRFRDDPAIDLVVLEGAGGRAFCAGGDVRAMRAAVLARDTETVERFFTTEYALNRMIAEFPKPWISLIDGVCMGGGIGVSIHGSHRVVTEHAMLAMPETAIALFPDVGTSYALPRLPGANGAMGKYLALTGARLHGAEAVEAGLATHHVPREKLAALREALLTGDAGMVERFVAAVPPGRVAAERPAIERCFAPDDIASIMAILAAEDSEWSRAQLAVLHRMSPTSMAVTLELLRRGAGMDLPACLAMELVLTRAVTRHPDFAEGVRAVLVDKDNAPRWQPATIDAVDPAAVKAMFG